MIFRPFLVLPVLLAVAGCAQLAVDDLEPDIGSRMHAIASRFEQSRRTGGMSGVIADIEQCYASATQLVIKVNALRDCLVLDYVGYRTDVDIGRRLFHQSLPYFVDPTFVTRQAHYGQLDGFPTPPQQMQYLRDANALVQLDIRQMNVAPVYSHPRKPVNLGQHHEGLE